MAPNKKLEFIPGHMIIVTSSKLEYVSVLWDCVGVESNYLTVPIDNAKFIYLFSSSDAGIKRQQIKNLSLQRETTSVYIR